MQIISFQRYRWYGLIRLNLYERTHLQWTEWIREVIRISEQTFICGLSRVKARVFFIIWYDFFLPILVSKSWDARVMFLNCHIFCLLGCEKCYQAVLVTVSFWARILSFIYSFCFCGLAEVALTVLCAPNLKDKREKQTNNKK